MQGTLWRAKTHVYGYTFNGNGDMFRLKPGELIVPGDGMVQGDMLEWANSLISPVDSKLASKQLWVKVLLPHQGWMNRTHFNRDSMWLERIA